MKKATLFVIALFFFSTCLLAQEKSKLKNVQEETITTTIVTKGVNEETTITETVNKETQVIEIKDSGVENQNEVYSTKKKETTNTTEGEVVVNKKNEAAIEELKKKQEEEIEASKKAQLQKYEAERKAMEESRPDKFRKKDSLSGH